MKTTVDQRYATGEYLQATGGTWHLEDSPFKAAQVMRMLGRHALRPRTVMEIGCGAGGILAELQQRLPAGTQFTGFEVSPQAHELSKRFEGDNLRFKLGDAFESGERADLVLVMDVIEHVEDCFAFLRKVKGMGDHKLYHIPLDVTCSATLRDSYLTAWRQVGHIHVFSRNLALESLRLTGHEILDHFYTPGALHIGRGWRAFLGNIPRRILPESLAARLVGGYSLMVLAR